MRPCKASWPIDEMVLRKESKAARKEAIAKFEEKYPNLGREAKVLFLGTCMRL